MKKCTLLLLAAATTAVCSAQSKFDAGSMMVMDSYKMLQRDPMASKIGFENLPVSVDAVQGRSDAKVSVFVTFNDGGKASDLEVRGFEVMMDLGDMVLASGTLADVEALADCAFVKNISFGEKRSAQLDRSRIATGVDLAHAGTDLSQPYKGAGVITGIFDTGLDPNHVNFLDDEFNSRISRLWHFTSSDGSSNVYNSHDAIKTFRTDNATETHGTHTLGCMAGSYNGNATSVAKIDDATGEVTVSRVIPPKKFPNPYYGMAPEATIAAGCGPLYDPNIVMAVKNIAQYAKSEGKPAVMNLSLGSCIGAHDGTDAVSRALESAGQDMIIFISSSNNGDVNMSVDKTFSASETSFQTLCEAPSNYSGLIDIWSSTDETFTITPFVYDLTTQSFTFEHAIDGSKEGSVIIATSNVQNPNKVTGAGFDDAFNSSSLTISRSKNTGSNNRYNVRINASINYKASNSQHNKMLGFRIEGKAGQRIMMTTSATSKVDGYDYSMEFSDKGQAGFTNGTPDFSINSMACGKNVISVGAWNARNRWPVLFGVSQAYQGEGWGVGEAAGFSSYGTLLDGTTLPHVCAPGSAIVSSISTPYMDRLSSQLGDRFSSYVTNNLTADQNVNGRHNYYEAEQGTSMSTPICAGGVALWLQADPTLTVDDVKQIIAETSDKDSFVTNGLYPAAKWGAGKFNAYAGLRKVLGLPNGVNNVAMDEKPVMISDAGNGAWDIFVPGASAVEARLFSISGQCVATANADGDSMLFEANDLQKGVYVLNVNGLESRRVIIK